MANQSQLPRLRIKQRAKKTLVRSEGWLPALGQDPTVAADSYSAALLQVPACNVMAIWLRDSASKEDLFVPVAPAPPPLTAGRQYATSQFLGALRLGS